MGGYQDAVYVAFSLDGSEATVTFERRDLDGNLTDRYVAPPVRVDLDVALLVLHKRHAEALLRLFDTA